MPRPKKWKKVCSMPEINKFGPLNSSDCQVNYIVMTIEEYETIRLIDYENLKQEDAAEHMKVARTTVQGIYDSARKKIADSIINGRILVIEGGDYMLCDGVGRHCRGTNCRRNTQE